MSLLDGFFIAILSKITLTHHQTSYTITNKMLLSRMYFLIEVAISGTASFLFNNHCQNLKQYIIILIYTIKHDNILLKNAVSPAVRHIVKCS